MQSLFTTSGARLYFRDPQFATLAMRDDATISGKPISEVERSGIGRLEFRDALLAGAGPVQWNKRFLKYTRLDNGRVRVQFTDKTFEDGDLLIGADGANSAVRKQYLPTLERMDLGIYAVAGRTLVTGELLSTLPSAMTDGSLNNIVPYGKGWMFVSAWRSKPAAGEKTDHYVLWAYVTSQAEVPEIASLGSSELRDLVLGAIGNWGNDLKTLLRESDISTVTCINIRSMPDLSPWAPTNVTLMGDSIHNMTPMAGVGANTALRDAEVLTRLLTDVTAGRISLLDAVGIYEDEMREYANVSVSISRMNAQNAVKGGTFSRVFLRGLLRAAHASPAVMRATFGKTALT